MYVCMYVYIYMYMYKCRIENRRIHIVKCESILGQM